MASPWDPFIKVEGIPAINGPASVNAILLDGVATANYEGIWVPWLYVKQGSLEVTGTFATLSCQLYGTNSNSPLNSWTITIGGSITATDVVTINLITPTGTFTFATTVVGASTTTTIAAALAAAIQGNLAAVQYGFQASNSSAVLTVTWPSPPYNTASIAPWTTSSPSVSPIVTVTSSVSGAATETVTVTAGSGGSALGSAITALGMTQFTFSARWLKIRVTTLTGGNVTAVAQGTA